MLELVAVILGPGVPAFAWLSPELRRSGRACRWTAVVVSMPIAASCAVVVASMAGAPVQPLLDTTESGLRTYAFVQSLVLAVCAVAAALLARRTQRVGGATPWFWLASLLAISLVHGTTTHLVIRGLGV